MEARLTEARGTEANLRAEARGLREAEDATRADLAACRRELSEASAEGRAALERAAQSERHASAIGQQQMATQAQIATLQARHAEQLARERDAHDAASRSLHEQLIDAREAAAAAALHGGSVGGAAVSSETDGALGSAGGSITRIPSFR